MGRVDEAGEFHKIPGIDDSRLAELFAREVLAILSPKNSSAPNGRTAFSPGGTRVSMSTAGSGPGQKERPSGWANT
jgi:hypothetical protein